PVSDETPPNLSFMIFSLSTGETLRASFPSLRYRRVPAGSLIKLFVALYCGIKREDLLRDYRYTCTGKNSVPETEPKRCWTPRGHGPLDLPGALRDSCNLYFASLHDKISRKDFFDFCRDLNTRLGLNLRLPPINDNTEFSRLLSGTDFRATVSIQGLITLARLAGPVQTAADSIERYRFGIPPASRKLLTGALYETVRSGTAAGPLHPFGPEENRRGLAGKNAEKSGGAPTAPLWGKTSTVLSGTNTCLSYGLFIGGDEERGIITLLRRGNGHTAARWAVRLLHGPD
ncbi:MAG TPA: hypothetical protein ENN21_10000, partial [Spirochaetes bacterium]|nr:hypothetical protein [Spirochaetota bacterium]